MKAIVGTFALLLVMGCASTWVDPRIHLRTSQVRVECLEDPLGLGAKIESLLGEEGVGIKPADSKAAGDLVLRVTYRYAKSNLGLYTIQSIKAEMVDLRYHSVEAKYQWDGFGDSQNEAVQKMVTALLER